MKIDLSKYRNIWWTDEYGEVFDDCNGNIKPFPDSKYVHYWTLFPNQITEHLDHYGYHPEGIYKLLINVPVIGDYVKRKIGRTFKPVANFTTTLSKASMRCAVEMVNSGDYDLDEALWVLAEACDRCTNALLNKYLGERYGYPEDSDEYRNDSTRCQFCEEDE